MKNHTKNSPKKIDMKDARKLITEQVMMERMSLDNSWDSSDGINVHYHRYLPMSISTGKTRPEIKIIERYVDSLVKLGCHRGVLYWCLERVLPDADDFRRKGSPIEVPDIAGPDMHLAPAAPLATREDMKSLISQLKTVSTMIHRHKRELSIAAQAFEGQISLPEDMFSEEVFDPIDAIGLLKTSIAWAIRLAENWAPPQITTIMRNKGILYLLAYIAILDSPGATIVAKGEDKTVTAVKMADNKGADQARSRIRNNASTIVHLVYACCGSSVGPPDLIPKLRAFRRDHPALYFRLGSLMRALDTEARSADVRDS